MDIQNMTSSYMRIRLASAIYILFLKPCPQALPSPPFLLFVGAKGKPGNETIIPLHNTNHWAISSITQNYMSCLLLYWQQPLYCGCITFWKCWQPDVTVMRGSVWYWYVHIVPRISGFVGRCYTLTDYTFISQLPNANIHGCFDSEWKWTQYIVGQIKHSYEGDRFLWISVKI